MNFIKNKTKHNMKINNNLNSQVYDVLTLVTLLARCFLMLNHLTDFMQVCMFANTCNNCNFSRKTNQTARYHPEKPNPSYWLMLLRAIISLGSDLSD